MLGVAHVAIQFPLYEYLKRKVSARHILLQRTPPPSVTLLIDHPWPEPSQLLHTLLTAHPAPLAKREWHADVAGMAQVAERREDGDPERLHASELIGASAASKMVASTATYPHEVIRSYMHIQGTGAFSGLGDTCRKVRMCPPAGAVHSVCQRCAQASRQACSICIRPERTQLIFPVDYSAAYRPNDTVARLVFDCGSAVTVPCCRRSGTRTAFAASTAAAPQTCCGRRRRRRSRSRRSS